jgi:hypothetical protein
MKKLFTTILNNKRSENFITVLVILNILVFNCGAEDVFSSLTVQLFDIFSCIMFTAEYAMRVAILEKPKDFFRPMLMMDLIAILPYFITILPCRTAFFKLISSCSDFYPTKIIESVLILITIGIHGLFMDLVAPWGVKYMERKGIKLPFGSCN